MKLEPFNAITNYSEMLNRISLFNLVGSLLAVVALRASIPTINTWLTPYSPQLPLVDIALPMGTVVPALVVTLLCRMVKLHERIGDMLRIRQWFDIDAILLPMAVAAGVQLSFAQQERLRQNRRRIMGDVFYKYVSSSKDKAQIDVHFITKALDQWTWYWVLLELAAVATIAAVIFLYFDQLRPVIVLLIGVLGIVLLLRYMGGVCAHNAQTQVEQILADNARKQAIIKAFHAL